MTRKLGSSFLLLWIGVVPAASATLAPAQITAANPASQATTATTKPSEKKEVKSYTLPPDKYEKAVAYSRARYRLYFIDFVYGVVVLLLVLNWRLAPRDSDGAGQASRRRFVQVIIYTPLLLLTLGLLGLPTEVYGHWLSREYDQSVQGWGSWAWDWTKGQLVGFVAGIILVWVLYGVIRGSARRWWFYFWLASLPILTFFVFLEPVVIEPLFFKFEPLAKTQPALVAEIERVVYRAGMNIPPTRMYEMKASEKLKALNAYVSGFGASKRVVLWDTTIEKMTLPETLFVFGHEMGHYVLYHIVKFIAFGAGLLFVFLYLGFRAMGWALGRRGQRWAIRGVDDWASLPVLLLFLSILSFLASPIFNSYSRHLEHQADIYGLEVTHGITRDSAQVAAQAFQILGEIDLADPSPSPFIKVWLYSHPPMGERIEFSLNYDPWSKGQPPQFVK